MKTHQLKINSAFFNDVLFGRKTFEVRKNDRDYQVGDILLLNGWDEGSKLYTKSQTSVVVTYVLQGGQFGIESGYCVLGIKRTLFDNRHF